MDWIAEKGHLSEYIKKFRYVFIVLLIGIFLMALPEGEKTEQQEQLQTEEAQPSLESELSKILSQLAGAGNVEVLLTEAEGEETIYQIDEDVSEADIHRDTVLTSGSDRGENGLIRQVNPPVYQGAVVLCQGADSAEVRLSIVEAVMSVTGLTSDRITVLKMK